MTASEFAAELAAVWGTSDPEKLAECLGIDVRVAVDHRVKSPPPCFVIAFGRVVLPDGLSSSETRYRVAHAIGHLVMQGPWPSRICYTDGRLNDRTEYEADTFAGRLLVPEYESQGVGESSADQYADNYPIDVGLAAIRMASNTLGEEGEPSVVSLVRRFEYTTRPGCVSTCSLCIDRRHSYAIVASIESPRNYGLSVTEGVGFLAAAVCEKFRIEPSTLVWLEVYPRDPRLSTTTPESCDFVKFDYDGETYFNPRWTPIQPRQLGTDFSLTHFRSVVSTLSGRPFHFRP